MSDNSTGGCYRSVVHGDVFEELPELNDDSAHAAIVDYPWIFAEEDGTGYFGNEGTNDREFEAFETESNDRLPVVLSELDRVLVDGSWIFVFADDDVYPEFREAVDESPLERRRTLVWDRCTIGMGIYFRSRHTLIIPATVGQTDRKVKDRGTVIEAVRQDGFLRENDYPTSKPVDLYRKLLAPPVLNEGERLLEPFCGSGPGARAAAERGLGYWGADVNPEAVERAEAAFEQRRLGITDGGRDQAIYLLAIRCPNCNEVGRYAHWGADVPLDQDAPWPDVRYCPKCSEILPNDLGPSIEEVANIQRVDPCKPQYQDTGGDQ